MEWGNIIVVIALAIVLPLAALLRKNKANAPKSIELLEYLQGKGIKATLVQEDSSTDTAIRGHFTLHPSREIIRLEKSSIDSIIATSVSGQYGSREFIECMVRTGNLAQNRKLHKTRVTVKRNHPFGGKTVTVKWVGDKTLSQSLNLDYRLEKRLLQASPDELRAGISISAEPKKGYIKMRIAYCFPSTDMLEALNIIAKHLKSW